MGSLPTHIVLLNRIVHLNTVNRIVSNSPITSFKIQHSPNFWKPMCDEARTIWFDPYCPFKYFLAVFFQDWNSWFQLLSYFFLAHHLKTLNKEQCDLTHAVLVVILKFFMKNTHGLAYVVFSNISNRLRLRNNTSWCILSIKEIHHVFIQAHNLLLLQRLLKIFSHGQYGFSHITLSKKYDQTPFELRCTS